MLKSSIVVVNEETNIDGQKHDVAHAFYSEEGKSISAHDNDAGKLIVMRQREDNVWEHIAVFNANCWKRWFIQELATKKIE